MLNIDIKRILNSEITKFIVSHQYYIILLLAVLLHIFQLIEMSQEKLNSFKVKKLSPPPMNYIFYTHIIVPYETQ